MADDKPVVGYSMLGAPITESRWRMPTRLPWWAWTLIVLAVLMVIGAFAGNTTTSGSAQKIGTARLGAFDVCKQAVAERLRAPATAKWRDPFGDQVTYGGDANGSITVMASVDSQNGFGALIRSSYTCTASPLGHGQWNIDSVNLAGS